uniref:Uncharacterized protein n=1 Tax=Physcomitrium patens TaxID=3218 RepID=A0A2K1KV07_PHYPA|nr:hypothetical protein PHYPA_004570 [Physcomitrium patens]
MIPKASDFCDAQASTIFRLRLACVAKRSMITTIQNTIFRIVDTFGW